jgi:EAL domain-containing protein (putative c-di-GMP-specific phosphodiesterase class I)
VIEVGRGVREQVARAKAKEGGDRVYFVNLHAAEVRDPELYAAQSPFTGQARQIVLELTERITLEPVRDLRERIRDLKGLGFRLAVDNVGIGYAGLANFAALEPDLVKLDRALVHEVDREPVRRRLVGAIARLCRDLGMKVVAEGVETPDERDTLVDLGCDLLQGNFLSPPKRRS